MPDRGPDGGANGNRAPPRIIAGDPKPPTRAPPALAFGPTRPSAGSDGRTKDGR